MKNTTATMLRILLIPVIATYAFRSQICDKDSSIDITKGTHLQNGDIYYKGVLYSIQDYYVDADTGHERGCICSKKMCIRKCCPEGYGYDYKRKTCERTDAVFNPPVWDSYRETKKNASELFNFVYGKMNCTLPSTRIRIRQVSPRIHLKTNGKLFIEVPSQVPPWMLRGADDYCVDTFLTIDHTSNASRAHLDALVCSKDEDQARLNLGYLLSSTCMVISCVFILATLAVYAWLPELRNLHGRVLMAYLSCLFVGFAFLASMQILILADVTRTQGMCLAMTLVIYFALLAAFFWLNVMSFDIWWTFSGKRGLSLERLSSRARFGAYCLYAFGMPSVLTALLTALELSDLPTHPLLPLIRQMGCFLYGNAKLIYLYGPMIILCLANMVFFILTAVKIAQIKKQTSVLNSKDSSTHDTHRKDRQRLLLYLKLFAVMGVNWILEVVSAMYPEMDFLKITDAYNVLIGLIIFIIFVCKRKILRLLKKRIKEGFHTKKLDPGDLRHFSRKHTSRWEAFAKEQRGSLDTIRTSICVDSDSSSIRNTNPDSHSIKTVVQNIDNLSVKNSNTDQNNTKSDIQTTTV